MESEVLLQPACELSYQIARDGIEADPAVDPPAAMRSFLYVDELSGRALTVAQQAIEDDPAFRRRVAEYAAEDEVGRAGYLWLHRPIGWAAEFEVLSTQGSGDDPSRGEADGDDDDLLMDFERSGPDAGSGETSTDEAEAAMDDGVRIFDPSASADGGDEEAGEETDAPAGAASALGFGSIENIGNGESGLDLSLAPGSGGRNEANAIEDELSSLRGLVDRLSSERKAVSTSVRRVEADVETSKHQPSMFDSDIYSLQSELETARAELDQARAERDSAIHQRSESLTRQLDLEKELERSRELRAELEREHEDVDAGVVTIKESLARAQATLTGVEGERDELRIQVTDLSTANESLNTQVARISDDLAAKTKSLQADHDALQAEADAARTENDQLGSSLTTAEAELADATMELSQTAAQATEAKSLVDALTEEKIDLASRLADTESMLETTRVQLNAVRSDSEAVTADLSNIKAHRDGLSIQVDELHGSLSEALNDLAKVRATSDADRAALKEVRTDRDELRVRVGSLEQVESGLEAKMTNVVAERDSLTTRYEQSQGELAQLQREVREGAAERSALADELVVANKLGADLSVERDELAVSVEELTSRSADNEASRDGLQRQVEQLNEENAAIQAQLVEADRLRAESAETQGHALSELAQRLSIVENERNRLEADLQEAEGRLSEALVTLEAARDEVERARGEESFASPGPGPSSAFPSPFGSAPQAAVSVAAEPATSEPDGSLADASVAAVSAEGQVGPAPADGGDEGPATTDTDDPFGLIPPSVAAEDEDQPPPPKVLFEQGAGDVVDSAVSEPVTAEPETLQSKDSDPKGEGSSRKRTVWGIGSLRRGDSHEPVAAQEQPPPPMVDEATENRDIAVGDIGIDEQNTDGLAVDTADAVEQAAESGLPDAVEDPDSVAAALAETLGGASSTVPVSDDEIDSISTELAQAIDDAGLDHAEDDEEDLDEISNLISQTVTDFDPKSIETENFDEEPEIRGGDGDSKSARPRWLFSGRADDEKRSSGPLPPSIFASSDETADDVDDAEPPSLLEDPTLLEDGAELGSVEETSTLPAMGGSSGAAQSGRRQIEIPSDLVDDEIEVARFVVSSPDVVLLVDGDSVAKLGWPSLPVAQQRDALVSYLADLSASTGAAPDVVFDGRIGEEESLPASRAVRIRLSTPPTEPAAALDELVDAYPEQWPIAVVTDDGELGQSAERRGAVVINNGQLLDLFIA